MHASIASVKVGSMKKSNANERIIGLQQVSNALSRASNLPTTVQDLIQANELGQQRRENWKSLAEAGPKRDTSQAKHPRVL